jgi:hypothetical protein
MAGIRDLIDTGTEQQSRGEPGTRELGEILADAGLPASDLARQAATKARRTVEHRAQDVMDWIRSRPLTSILIGAGLGYLFGRMTRR